MARGSEVVNEDATEGWARSDLLTLYDSIQGESNTWINIAYQYLNFYVGLLSAIFAATLAGLIHLRAGDSRLFLLLIGPVGILVLASVGFASVRAMYGRFYQHWVSLQNLEAVMGLSGSFPTIGQSRPPIRLSRYGGLLTQWELLRDRLEGAAESESAESIVKAILDQAGQLRLATLRPLLGSEVRLGETLSNARLTFAFFQIASLAVIVLIVLLATT